MSADWFFVRHGWFYSWLHKGKKIGPIDEHDFLLRIDRGEILPDTLVQSATKTRGRWVRMSKIKPALERWNKSHPPEPPLPETHSSAARSAELAASKRHP